LWSQADNISPTAMKPISEEITNNSITTEKESTLDILYEKQLATN